MTTSKKNPHCLSCGTEGEETPLVTLQYKGKTLYICPQCMPVIIHHPDRLAEKLASA